MIETTGEPHARPARRRRRTGGLDHRVAIMDALGNSLAWAGARLFLQTAPCPFHQNHRPGCRRLSRTLQGRAGIEIGARSVRPVLVRR
jgi:hypothetical protein